MLNLYSRELQQQDFAYPVRLTLLNRFPFHPFMYDRAWFATSAASLPVTIPTQGDILTRCQRLDQELRRASLELTAQTMTDKTFFQTDDNQFALFTCMVEQDLSGGPLYAKRPDILYCNFDLPTPMIDYSIWEQGGQLMFRWTYSKVLPMQNADMESRLLAHTLNAQNHDSALTTSTTTEAPHQKHRAALALAGLGGLAGVTSVRAAEPKKKSIAPVGKTVAIAEQIAQSSDSSDVMHNAFNNIGKSLVALGNTPRAWQQTNTDNNPSDTNLNNSQPNTNVTSEAAGGIETKSNLDSILDKLDPKAPAAIIAAIISGLAGVAPHGGSSGGGSGGSSSTPSSSSNLPSGNSLPSSSGKDNQQPPAQKPQTPSGADAKHMTPAELNKAFADYADKAKKVHQFPSKDQVMQNNLCVQFAALTGNLGPDTDKVKSELSALGAKVDAMSTAVASGDPKAIADQVGGLSDSHAALLDKMSQQGLLDTASQNPLVTQSQDIYKATQNVETPDQVKNLNDKLDAFDGSLTDYESKISPPDTSDLQKQLSDQYAQSPIADKVKAAQDKAAEAQDLANQYSQYDCKALADKASGPVIDKLLAKTQELQAQIPEPPANPIAQKMADTQDAFSNYQQTLANKQTSMPNTDPSQLLQHPDVQDALNKLNDKANAYAQAVHSHCPICSSSDPNLPKLPGCGHNHADALNSMSALQIPQINLNASMLQLSSIPQPSMPTLSATNKLQSLIDRVKAFSPSAGGASFTSPVAALQSAVTNLLSQLTSQDTSLANCPSYTDISGAAAGAATGAVASKQQQVQGAIASLKAAQDKLAALRSGSGSSNGDKAAALKQQMQDAMTQGISGGQGALQQQAQGANAAALAGATGCVTGACYCIQSMQIPGGLGAEPGNVIVSGAKLQCLSGTNSIQSITALPGAIKVENKDVLVINGSPLQVSFGQCNFLGSPPPACCSIVTPSGGSNEGKAQGINIATFGDTIFTCGVGQLLKAIDNGQDKSKAPTTMGG
jgi:hypothetical protein